MKVTVFDIIVIALYFITCLAIGLYRFNKIDTPRKFAFGHSPLSNIILTSTLFASVIGAGTIFGHIEKLYMLGGAYLIAQLIKPLSLFITVIHYSLVSEVMKSITSTRFF